MKVLCLLLLQLLFGFYYSAGSLIVTINADKINLCPGDTAHIHTYLTGNILPDSALTRIWSIEGQGILSNDSNYTINAIMGDSGDLVISVEVIEGDDTARSAITLYNAGFHLKITATPDTLECNDSVKLHAFVSGSSIGQEGMKFHWNSFDFPDTATVQLKDPGRYIVNVTNTHACKASDTIVISYRAGISNSVDFMVPSRLCQCQMITFINTSEKKELPWTPYWQPSINYDPSIIYNGIDMQHIYKSPMNDIVSLTMDSLGCKFRSLKLISVLPYNNAQCGPGGNNCVAGIGNEKYDDFFQVYPNPAIGKIYISHDLSERIMEVSVFDMEGRVIASQSTTLQMPIEIDTQHLPDGVYFVQVKSVGEKVWVKKFIVLKE